MTLQELTISSSHSDYFDQLLNLDQHPSLRTIYIRYISSDHLRAIGKLLKTIGSGIEDVYLDGMGEALGYSAKGSISLLLDCPDLTYSSQPYLTMTSTLHTLSTCATLACALTYSIMISTLI